VQVSLLGEAPVDATDGQALDKWQSVMRRALLAREQSVSTG